VSQVVANGVSSSAWDAAAAKAAAVVRLGGILIHATWGSRTQ
jgi:hypothetical protein